MGHKESEVCHLCKEVFNYLVFFLHFLFSSCDKFGSHMWSMATCGTQDGWSLKTLQQGMSILDFVCMRNNYCVRQLRFGDCLLQQLELVILTNRGIFYCIQIGQKGESSALFVAQKKKAAPDTWKLSWTLFHWKSTLDRALTDHDIKKKQDYYIIRSEHREKCKHWPNQKNHQTSPCLE